MGNAESEVNDSLKAQAGGEGAPPLYKLIAVGGGGIIFDLMKTAMQTQDFTEVDAMIKSELPPYLYNNGAGAMVPVKDLVLKRAGKKPIPAGMDSFDEKNTKLTGWIIDKAGAVGETLLHVCMLMGSVVHIELAKRLLFHFPVLINDTYLSEDYYGENVLHMAIVSEDPGLVKYFLQCGANVHERAHGKFFTPDDQKSGRLNTLSQEAPILPVDTNYVCLSYFGEYPLSFAACINQSECIRLLIAYNADPNKQDSNGNTVLHMMVIKDNMKMFEFMLQFDVRLDIKNNQGLTPLSLAAKLARKEMFDFILERLRKVEWHYMNISCGAYPLDTIDTITPDGQTDTTSSIYSICYGESEEHLELLEGYITNLINVKWETYIKQAFYTEVIIYFVYFLLSAICLILRRTYFDHLIEIGCTYTETESTHVIHECSCSYLYPNDSNAKFRIFIEIFTWLYTFGYCLLILNEILIQGIKPYFQTLLLNPFKIFFILSLFCTLLCVPMRYSCNDVVEDYLIVISILMKSLYILFLGRGFTRTCTFVYIIHQVIKTQYFVFLCVWIIFAMGFSQAFYISYDYGFAPIIEVMQHPLIAIRDTGILLVNDILAVYDNMILTEQAVVGRVLLMVYMILGGVMLINLLIAMMCHTYDVTHELEREPYRQWARQVLIIEQNIPTKERLKQQKKYAHILKDGSKSFIVRWKQTDEERRELKQHMKIIFKKVLATMENELNNQIKA